ncbi:MAG: phosphotransferase, partial [Clostridia bacterium]|nr:phosphotransferase [Clostridia bacterium]
YAVFQSSKAILTDKVLLHGDYCLPNVILNDWKFSGFIDVGQGGVGDRHVDVFWGIWTLEFNLKTNAYRNRFLDAYGRDLIDEEKLKVIGAIEVFG